jgi:hypothetical protein
MSDAPSVLILDDGELDHVHRMLKRIGADYVRLQRREIGRFVDQPRDLLISSGKRSLEMPQLKSMEGLTLDPAWVCVHNQDFLPLRQRLRDLGVHFLVHTALDEESLRRFLLQMLHRGPDRRARLRLPLGESIRYRSFDGELEPAKLAELSSDMCRIFSARAVEPQTAVYVVLPAALGGGSELELQGHAVRCAVCESRSGERAFSVMVRLNDLAPKARVQLEKLVRGEQIGTRLSPLAQRSRHEPGWRAGEPPEPQAPEQSAPGADRRRHPRWDYDRRVHILDFDDSDAAQAALGHDLSIQGVRIVDHPGLEVGAEVTLALYGGRREEPVVVEAMVLRDDGEDGLTLTFKSVSENQKRALEKLNAARPCVEALRGGSGRSDGVVVAQVTRAQA